VVSMEHTRASSINKYSRHMLSSATPSGEQIQLLPFSLRDRIARLSRVGTLKALGPRLGRE